jgi:dolichyldiphosphatase
MDAPPLASLSLTHVHYDPTDPSSHFCAYLALVPQALVITYVALIWATREVEICLMFAGQLGCEALNWVLKRCIQQARPSRELIPSGILGPGTGVLMQWTEMHGKGYGMPSSHAQFVAYFSTFLTLFLLLRHSPHHPHASSTHIPTPYWQRLGLASLSIICAGAVAQSRIYLNYHTPQQVYAGVAAGVLCGVGWFVATSIARQYGLVEMLLELPVARWVRLRDLVVDEDLVDAGWERWETRKRRRAEMDGRKAR